RPHLDPALSAVAADCQLSNPDGCRARLSDLERMLASVSRKPHRDHGRIWTPRQAGDTVDGITWARSSWNRRWLTGWRAWTTSAGHKRYFILTCWRSEARCWASPTPVSCRAS